jgi:hypothetical protein
VDQRAHPGPQDPPGLLDLLDLLDPLALPPPTPEYAVVGVFVQRGTGNRTLWALYSAPLGSPAGTTTGGYFRFTCTPAHETCKVSYGAAVISDQTGNAVILPRLLIHKQADLVDAPITFCEYADGADNNGGARVDTARADVGGRHDRDANVSRHGDRRVARLWQHAAPSA